MLQVITAEVDEALTKVSSIEEYIIFRLGWNLSLEDVFVEILQSAFLTQSLHCFQNFLVVLYFSLDVSSKRDNFPIIRSCCSDSFALTLTSVEIDNNLNLSLSSLCSSFLAVEDNLHVFVHN